MELREKIKELPTNSGVYIMKNASGEVIYVGKAKNLKNRVSQYFQVNKNHTVKVKAMVSNIADFTYVIVKNEYEAFALENNLIKRFQPYYNILLKDSKSYPYIKIDLREDFPRLVVTRRLVKDGSKYFGPYFAGIRPQEILKAINLAYPLRLCSGSKVKPRKRPCLNYDIGLCSGPCVNKISKEDYMGYVRKVINFLNGDDSEVKKILTDKMLKCADNEQFETALTLRDTIKSLDRLGEHTLAFLPRFADMDCFAWFSNGMSACIGVLVVRGGKSVGVDCFPLIDSTIDEKEAVSEFITQYYTSVSVPPSEIVVDFEVNKDDDLYKWVNDNNHNAKQISFTYPHKGDKWNMLQMAKNNAELYIDKFIEREKRIDDMTYGAVTRLGELLGLQNRPVRMECYDISNIGGVLSVASMVVFYEGEPRTEYYRKFKIKTVQGVNDFASMQEVITRRLLEINKEGQKDIGFKQVPDLIVVDGGKGQLSNAYEAIQKCGFDIPVVSLAKQEEKIFTTSSSNPILLPRSNNVLKLLQRIRDESHRFAITFHRSLRNKVSSILEEIDGIGPQKRKNLFKTFKSLEGIKKASIDELLQVKGINKANAQAIYKYFNES